MLLTGQMNPYHEWEPTTVALKDILEATGLFAVDVMVSPPRGEDLSGFAPAFGNYPVVLLNIDSDAWSAALHKSFEEYVYGGGGVVVYHSASNAFKDWVAFNEICGAGGWGDRDASAGPLLHWRDGNKVSENKPGRCGSHGPRHEFVVTFREADPLIGKGLPSEWMHAEDELYDSLRGPAKNLDIVASAFSAKEKDGTEEHEPMLMTIRFGEGRIFHTTLGHDVPAMQCVGFQFTLLRGTEWAATGDVSLPVPEDFPTKDEVRLRR